MTRWCVLQCRPGKTDFAGANVREQGFEVLVPKLRVHRARGEVLQPLFGSYIFTQITPEGTDWRPLSYTKGVLKVLCGSPERPSLLPRGWAEQLLALGGVIDRFEDALAFQRGDLAEFVSGPLCGQAGRVQWTGPRRIALLLQVLGRETCVYATPELLKKA